MRLSKAERKAIQGIIRRKDRGAKIYLYGSRSNDRLRGGDIDLLILSERLSLLDKVDILDNLKDRLGEQRIDVLIKKPSARRSDPFVARILKSAVLVKS